MADDRQRLREAEGASGGQHVRGSRDQIGAGRQTRSSSGIFGRFDGATITARPAGQLRFDVSAGYPIFTPRDLSFDPHRFFYAAGVEYEGETFDLGLYHLRQTSYDFVDREAVGTELRYVTDKVSMFGLADYDTHYSQLNIAMASGTFRLPAPCSISPKPSSCSAEYCSANLTSSGVRSGRA